MVRLQRINCISRLCSWQILPVFAWLLFVSIAAEPLFCQSGCQYRPHYHAKVLVGSADGAIVDTTPLLQTFICLLSDPLPSQDSQQPATNSGANHEHLAVQTLLVLILTVTLVLGKPHITSLLSRAWILAPLDRPPIQIAVYS